MDRGLTATPRQDHLTVGWASVYRLRRVLTEPTAFLFYFSRGKHSFELSKWGICFFTPRLHTHTHTQVRARVPWIHFRFRNHCRKPGPSQPNSPSVWWTTARNWFLGEFPPNNHDVTSTLSTPRQSILNSMCLTSRKPQAVFQTRNWCSVLTFSKLCKEK